MKKAKLRKSYLFLSNGYDLNIYQYQIMPRKPFIKGTLRSSWFSLDTSQESLDDILNNLMSAYIKNQGMSLRLGSNPHEDYTFSYKELGELIVDFILAKKYFALKEETDDLRESLLDGEVKLDYSNISSYEHKSKMIGLYMELLENRDYTNKFSPIMFDCIEVNAIKEFNRLRDNKTVEEMENETVKGIQ